MTKPTEGFTEKGQSDGRLVLPGIRFLIPKPKASSLDNYHFAVRRPPVSDGRLARAGGGAKKRRRSLRTGRCPPNPAPGVDLERPFDVPRHADDRRACERLALTGLA